LTIAVSSLSWVRSQFRTQHSEVAIHQSPGNSLETGGGTSERLVAAVLLVIITMAVYIPVVNQEFSQWDDLKYVSVVWKPGWARAWTIATDYKLEFIKELYFNPIHFLSLMADQALLGSGDGPQAWISKLANVAYHTLNSVLVFIFLLVVGTSRVAAFMGALLFAVHPVQVGTVAWIAERKNLLATCFCLSSIIFFVRYVRTGSTKFLPLICVLFAAGLLSKPSAVMLPAVLIATVFVMNGDNAARTRALLFAGSLLIIAVGYGLNVARTERTLSWILPSWEYRPMLAAAATWFYAGKFVVPVHLSPIYPKWNVVAHIGWFGLLTAGLMGLLAAVACFRKRIDRWVLWGLMFFLVNLAPVSGLIPFGYMSHSFVADHLVYLPMVGLVAVTARLIQILVDKVGISSTRGRLIVLGVYVWIGLLAVASVRQEWLWRNPASMWEAVLELNPTSPAAFNNYGYLCLKRGDLEKAEKLFRKASEFGPGLDKPYLNLGYIYQAKGELDTAKEMFAKAFTLNPEDVHLLVLQSKILQAQGKPAAAVGFLDEYRARFQSSAEFQTGLGLAYSRANNEDKALELFGKAIELNPFLAEPYVHKAAIMLSRDHPDEAVRLAGEALKLANRPDAHNVLGAAYGHKGDHAKALTHFLSAYKLWPDFPNLRDNVANALADLGNYSAAEEFCRKSEEEGKPCASDTLKRVTDRN